MPTRTVLLSCALVFLATQATAESATATAAGFAALPDADEATVERYRELVSQGNEALREDRPARAARLYRRALRIDDANEGTWYNLACAEARRGQVGSAMDALERATDAGWSDPRWPQRDTDLEPLHGTVAFTEWIDALENADANESPWPRIDGAALASSPEEIEERADAREDRLSALAGFIGSAAMRGARRELAAWRAASWLALADRAEGDEALDARLEALRAIAGRDVRRIDEVAARALLAAAETADWSAAEPELATEARLLGAHARHVLATSGEEADTDLADQELERELLMIAATGEGDAIETALARLVGLSSSRPDAVRLIDRLEELAGPDDARDLVVREDRGTWFAVRGLPEFDATTLDGQRLTRADLKGAVTLVDFWATWCGPCVAELPELKRAVAELGDRGFRVIGISLDDVSDKDEAAFTAWCEENGVTWPQVYDGKGWQAEMAQTFGVRSIPFPMLLDAEGDVIATDGDLRGERLFERVREALEATRAAGDARSGALGQ